MRKKKKKKKTKRMSTKPRVVLRFSNKAEASMDPKTQVPAVSKVSDDAETFMNYMAHKQQLKVVATLHHATIKYVGGMQSFFNCSTSDRHRFEEMARLGPRSLVTQMCLGLAATATSSTLDKIVCDHEKVYLAYLVKHGLQNAADLRKAIRNEQPSLTLKEREKAKDADEAPPVFTSVTTGVPTAVPTGVPTAVLKATAQTTGAAAPTDVPQAPQPPADVPQAPQPPAAVPNASGSSVPSSVPTGGAAWQEALRFIRSEEVLKDAQAGFMIIDGNKYTSTSPHPSWVEATYGGNKFLGVSFEDSGGKKRKRPWRAKVKRKTIGRFATILQAAHARALYTQTY